MKLFDALRPSPPQRPEVQITNKEAIASLGNFPYEVQEMLRNITQAGWDTEDRSAEHLQGLSKWIRSDGVTTHIARDAHHVYFLDFKDNDYIGRAIIDREPSAVFSFNIQPTKRHQMFATHLLITINEYLKGTGNMLSAGRPAAMTDEKGNWLPEAHYRDAHKLWQFLVDHGFATKLTDEKGVITYRFRDPNQDDHI